MTLTTEKLLVGACLIIVSLFFLIIGIQLMRGKWLRLLAGNTFGDAPQADAQKAGRSVGLICFICTALASSIFINIIFNSGTTLTIGLGFSLFIIAVGYTAYQYVRWAKGK